MKVTEDTGMTLHELAVIGEIVAQWGSIEHEIFVQTVATFVDLDERVSPLPKEMNNLNFLEVLALWKGQVVDVSRVEHRAVLLAQYENLVRLSHYRNAIVHGMRDWDGTDPKTLITTRVRKKEIISTRFKAGDLNDLATSLGEINFLIRHPGGLSEALSKSLNEEGCYVSAAFIRQIQLDREAE